MSIKIEIGFDEIESCCGDIPHLVEEHLKHAVPSYVRDQVHEYLDCNLALTEEIRAATTRAVTKVMDELDELAMQEARVKVAPVTIKLTENSG